jgi:hypothetical protein
MSTVARVLFFGQPSAAQSLRRAEADRSASVTAVNRTRRVGIGADPLLMPEIAVEYLHNPPVDGPHCRGANVVSFGLAQNVVIQA